MTFPPRDLSTELQRNLARFLQSHDFVSLYRSYEWKRDMWSGGFPDILGLESQIQAAAMKNQLNTSHVIAVASWGEMRNIKRVRSSMKGLRIYLYDSVGKPLADLEKNPVPPLVDLQSQVKGLGPTYLSEVIRFAQPQEYGAIDTRIVRVFGRSDPESQCENWLDLGARNDGYGWYISKHQGVWPSDYGKWVNIIRFLSCHLNQPDGQPCPHPIRFVEDHLRSKGVWACADVEMALFSYASQFYWKFNQLKSGRKSP